MHLYWRVIEELRFIGEMWRIKDPAILRYYRLWLEKHREAINRNLTGYNNSNPVIEYKGITHSLN